MRRIAVGLAALAIAGCTTIQVDKVDPKLGMKHVCIEVNPKVIVRDFLPVVRDAFQRHGITTEMFSGTRPESCEFTMTYTALQNWDMALYMHHAELRIERNGSKVASAEYHLAAKGGLDMGKWASTKAKMDPVIDQMLAQ
jgi:hypothetical protein